MDIIIQSRLHRGLLVDTNLLLLLFVGSHDQTLIERFKRTRNRGYTADDFVLLRNLVGRFSRIVTTPHILAELSNLSMHMPTDMGRYFACLARALGTFREEQVPKDDLLSPKWRHVLPRIGFTDLSIIEAAPRGDYLVLTDDCEAANCLYKARCAVININHIRGCLWLRKG